jgi:antitoxin (DNA-binding transcriptional repressor) of toxin-antitoxin stability system
MRVGIREPRDRLKHSVESARGGEEVIITITATPSRG